MYSGSYHGARWRGSRGAAATAGARRRGHLAATHLLEADHALLEHAGHGVPVLDRLDGGARELAWRSKSAQSSSSGVSGVLDVGTVCPPGRIRLVDRGPPGAGTPGGPLATRRSAGSAASARGCPATQDRAAAGSRSPPAGCGSSSRRATAPATSGRRASANRAALTRAPSAYCRPHRRHRHRLAAEPHRRDAGRPVQREHVARAGRLAVRSQRPDARHVLVVLRAQRRLGDRLRAA